MYLLIKLYFINMLIIITESYKYYTYSYYNTCKSISYISVYLKNYKINNHLYKHAIIKLCL